MKFIDESLGLFVWLHTGQLQFTKDSDSPDLTLYGSQYEVEIGLTQHFLKRQMKLWKRCHSKKSIQYLLEDLVVGQNPQNGAAVEEKLVTTGHRDVHIHNDWFNEIDQLQNKQYCKNDIPPKLMPVDYILQVLQGFWVLGYAENDFWSLQGQFHCWHGPVVRVETIDHQLHARQH
jgi:hypothetical protein